MIEKQLRLLADKKYQTFNASLIPCINKETVIGVKTPQLKVMAKALYKSAYCKRYIQDLPHKYFEENQIHAFVIAENKDFYKCITELELFLPYIDNWATCDQLSPKVFAKYKNELISYIYKWIASDHVYTVRFAVNMLMKHFLGDDFKYEYCDWVADIASNDYYVNMVRAWYFATALAKQWDNVIPYMEKFKLDKWTHNKTIQKSVESLRITGEQKEYLKTLKIKTG